MMAMALALLRFNSHGIHQIVFLPAHWQLVECVSTTKFTWLTIFSVFPARSLSFSLPLMVCTTKLRARHIMTFAFAAFFRTMCNAFVQRRNNCMYFISCPRASPAHFFHFSCCLRFFATFCTGKFSLNNSTYLKNNLSWCLWKSLRVSAANMLCVAVAMRYRHSLLHANANQRHLFARARRTMARALGCCRNCDKKNHQQQFLRSLVGAMNSTCNL